MKSTATILTIAALAGAAHAQFTYSNVPPVDRIRMDLGGNHLGEQFENEMFVAGDAAFGPTTDPRVFSEFFSATSADAPQIDLFTLSYDSTIEVTGERLSIDWDKSMAITTNSAMTRPDTGVEIFAQQFNSTNIVLSEAATIRVTVMGESYADLPADAITRSEIIAMITSSTGSFADVDYQIGTGSGSPDAVSFVYDAPAGEIIGLGFESDMRFASPDSLHGDYSMGQSGTLRIEIVPAPGSLSLLGLAGFGLVRRRR